MWHLSLHKPGKSGQVQRLHITAHSRSPALEDRRYLVTSLPIPFARIALFDVDVWRPLTPHEQELWRNHPMDGEIRPMSDEEREQRRSIRHG